MWRRLSICLMIVVWATVVSAQEGLLELQLINNDTIRILPGSSTNVVVKLVNHSKDDQQVSLRLQMPPGWKCFSALKDLQVPPSKSSIKILSIHIPSGFRAGDYSISLQAIDRQDHTMGSISVPVTVEPQYALNVHVVDGSEYVFANDTFTVQFGIQNRSNSRAEIKGLLKGGGIDEEVSYSLSPDSTVFITRKINAEKGILKSVKKNVSFTASMVNLSEVRASSTHFYTVIPSGDVQFDPYNRFPVKVSSFFVTDNPRGRRIYALMGEVNGQGFLDVDQTQLLRFQFRGPDRRGKPLYGINDQYFMEYSTPRSKMIVGDHTYKLSYLTEYARYGRGSSVEHTFKQLTVGSFINFPRFYPKIKREVSFYAAYTSLRKMKLQMGYLNKLSNTGDVNHLLTLNGSGSPLKGVILDGEYAMGTFGELFKKAFKTEMKINFKPVGLLFNYTMAEKSYPGYFTDTRYLLANGTVRLSGKIDLGANYNFNHQNAALDTLYASAPFSKNLFFTLNYRFMKDGRLSASYNVRERQDRMETKKFDYSEQSMRFIFNKRVRNVGMDLLGEYGNTENLLLPENERLNAMYRSRLTLNYKNSAKFNVNGFVSYHQNNRYIVKDRKNWVYGASIHATVSKKLSLFGNYQSSYNMEEYYLDRSLVDGRVSYSPNINNSIEISSRYNLIKNSLDVKEFAFMVKFVHTFNLPVSKKKNIGKLSGRVINKGVATIEGMVLSIGTNQAVTDKEGNYSFPMLPAGKYYMMIDHRKAGVRAITELSSPYPVEIQPGIETKYDIGITLSSKIRGQIVIVKDVAEDDKTYAGIRNQLGKLMIEAKNEQEVFRILTNAEGGFSFESLRPGQWTVRVYDTGIPKEYELVTNLFNVTLDPGQSADLEVKIKEKRRRIKFQKLQ